MLSEWGVSAKAPTHFYLRKGTPRPAQAWYRAYALHKRKLSQSTHTATKKTPVFSSFFAHQVLPMPAPCVASVISLLALCSLIRLRYSIYFSNCTGTPSVVFLYIACTIKHNTYDPSQSIITCTILVGYCTITSITKSYMCK